MNNNHKPLSKKDQATLDAVLEHFKENHLIYAPGSVWHGWPNDGNHKDVTKLKIELARLNDFVEFLFEHSEHCDHITQSDAWAQFEQYTFRKHKHLIIDQDAPEEEKAATDKVS